LLLAPLHVFFSSFFLPLSRFRTFFVLVFLRCWCLPACFPPFCSAPTSLKTRDWSRSLFPFFPFVLFFLGGRVTFLPSFDFYFLPEGLAAARLWRQVYVIATFPFPPVDTRSSLVRFGPFIVPPPSFRPPCCHCVANFVPAYPLSGFFSTLIRFFICHSLRALLPTVQTVFIPLPHPHSALFSFFSVFPGSQCVLHFFPFVFEGHYRLLSFTVLYIDRPDPLF